MGTILLMPRGILVALVLAVAGAAAGGYVLLSDDAPGLPSVDLPGIGGEDDVPPAVEDLATSRADVSLSVDVKIPKGSEKGKQRFSGEGTANFAEQLSTVMFDFEDLANAAGYFGHLEEFDVVFAEEGTYIDIFNGSPAWVLFENDEDIERIDIGRLREVVLSSPLVVPELLHAATSDGTALEEEHELDVDSLEVEGEAAIAVVELLDTLGAEEVLIKVEADETSVTGVDYEVEFPIAPGKAKTVALRVRMDIDVSEAVDDIEPPDEDDVQSASDIFG